ncbi:MAG: 4-(cytidine 5'-diphospho)-2-C-methyl-D-erythritol kinase [Phycisphaerales bacterium JB060]
MDAMHLRAFAKLNLALAVAPPEAQGPRRGWHRICSWMHAIDLHDDVAVEVDRSLDGPVLDARWADDAPVHAGQPMAWDARKDLALRAAKALDEAAPLRITLRKRIPDGGGLGGGSSDAAAVLRAANVLLGLGHSHARLREMAMTLGSDIAFFIDDADATLDTPPRPAIVGGFGDTIERLASQREPVQVTLAVPPFGCATGEVYAAFDTLGPGPLRAAEVRSLAMQSPMVATLFNDLERPAMSVRPELAALRDELVRKWQAPVHMTGSGSALFTLGAYGGGPCTIIEGRLV